MTEVSAGYPHSPLNGLGLGGPGPTPGERFRPALDPPLAGAGADPRFALFSPPGEAADALARRFDPLIELRAKPDHVYGLHLVRPDGYLACSSIELEEIAAYLYGLVPSP